MNSYHLNDYEHGLLGALSTGLDAGMDPTQALGIYQGTMQGAIQRRQDKMAQQQAGLTGLMQQAAQMATSGADPATLQDYVMGQASSLPMMGGDRGMSKLGGLMSFTQGLYPDGSDISGLAPPDVRAAYGGDTDQLAESDRPAVGQVVLKGIQSGTPFVDIRNSVTQALIASGYDPSSPALQEGMTLAEQQYESMTGASLGNMRSAADELRSLQASGSVDDLNTDNSGVQGILGKIGDETDIQGIFGQASKDPGQFRSLIDLLNQQASAPTTSNGSAFGSATLPLRGDFWLDTALEAFSGGSENTGWNTGWS